MPQDKKCPSCGGVMLFEPERNKLVCQYCGNMEDIPEINTDEVALEVDISTAKSTASHDWGISTRIVHCSLCGAETVNDALQMSGRCPFCGSTTVTSIGEDDDMIAPNAVIPFKITQGEVEQIFRKWISKRFFAPSGIKNGSKLNGFTGVYLPYWTFDADTVTDYSGRFGYDRMSGDKRYTDWKTRKGTITKFLNDYPVFASRRFLSNKYYKRIGNYNTDVAKKYTPAVLAGFLTERYSIGIEEAWTIAKQRLITEFRREAKIRENADQIHNVDVSTTYSNIKFKYVLAPLWISSYSFKGRKYTIFINGQTGDISGTCPTSMAVAIFILIFVIGMFIMFIVGIILTL